MISPPSPATGRTPEPEFRSRLTALIERYDEAMRDVGDGDDDETEASRAWHEEFEELLMDTTHEQNDRALSLLELHVQNMALHDD